MGAMVMTAVVAVKATAGDLRERVAGEAGEGVISAAIAVLIMAFLGAAMWVAFDALFQDAAAKIQTNVNQIGG